MALRYKRHSPQNRWRHHLYLISSNAYSTNLFTPYRTMFGSRPTSPVPEPPLPSVLDPVQVPPGYFPIEVVQYWRGEYTQGRPLPLHWAIIVRTSARRGNRHEIVGDMYTFSTQDRFDVPLHEPADWRGSHIIGYVSPTRMDDLLNHIALVPVVRHRWTWNCQNWVYEALEGLNDHDLYTDVNLTFEALQTQMSCLLEAWEMGDI